MLEEYNEKLWTDFKIINTSCLKLIASFNSYLVANEDYNKEETTKDIVGNEIYIKPILINSLTEF